MSPQSPGAALVPGEKSLAVIKGREGERWRGEPEDLPDRSTG